MVKNIAKHRLQLGEPAIGTWVTLADTVGIEALGDVGFDWLVIDREHTALSFRDITLMCQAVARYNLTTMARLSCIAEGEFKQVLSAGVGGLVIPDVRTKMQVENIVEWSRFPPIGRRGVGGSRTAWTAGFNMTDYINQANSELLVVVQIESVEALASIDGILSVEGLDACYVGLDDLAVSMGVSLDKRDGSREFEQALDLILTAAKRNGITAGTHTKTPDDLRKRITEGWQMVGISSDLNFMRDNAMDVIGRVRASLSS